MRDRKQWIENHFFDKLTPESQQVLELLPEHVRSALFHAAVSCYNTGHQDAWSAIGTGRVRDYYIPDPQEDTTSASVAYPHEVA